MNEKKSSNKVNDFIKTKKVETFFNKLIYQTKKVSNEKEAKSFRKKLLISGIISIFVSTIIIVLSILGFIFLNNFNFTFVIPLIFIILGFIVLIIGSFLLYLGLVILVAGEASKHFDESKICPHCFTKIEKTATICPNCNKEIIK